MPGQSRQTPEHPGRRPEEPAGRQPLPAADDPADDLYRRADHPAAGLHDLHGLHQLFEDRQPSGAVRLGRAAELRHPLRFQLGAGLHLLERAGLDAGLGVLRHLHQLHRRHDPGHRHQPQGDQGQRVLALLLRAALRGADVRLAADHAHDAPAGRRRQRAAAPARLPGRRRKPALLYRPDLGAGDRHHHQHLGRRALHPAAAHRRIAEHPHRTVRGRQGGRRQRLPDLLPHHAALHAVCDHPLPDRHLHRQREQLQRHLPAFGRRPGHQPGLHRRQHRPAGHLAVQADHRQAVLQCGRGRRHPDLIILAIGSLLTYRNSKSYREEGGI